ncbi:RNA polymerase sigma factor [Hymenobacter caeli]|uniref:RNA polymerase sigma-70 factor (ECF subfamily) n=1 Tax=Hymenobacter caeli TaxID=2735894 RepID=A0ABX2FJL7_9BACT|nr:sigma-70 family RNA polymerase sigma factor [Hymenobacter caeli]NRT17216.1 RNA polymerase sigma-70 factor (ECF subfamily) [Hymenobacter caeli]
MKLLPTLPPAADESVLVAQLLARDERAFGLLYERYSVALLAVIRRITPDEAQAQDLLQEGLLKIWLGIGGYDAGRGRLFTWMARVCGNHALDAVRSAGHRFYRGTRSLEVPAAQHVRAPVAFRPEHIGLRELTQHLIPRQWAVIDLLYFGGCTQLEAAQELGIPVATVKTRARAALRTLALLARCSQLAASGA